MILIPFPQNEDLLNLGTGSVSWFEANGYGCKPIYNITAEDPFRPLRPQTVEDCLLDYQWVEVIHSAVQSALAVSKHTFTHIPILYINQFKVLPRIVINCMLPISPTPNSLPLSLDLCAATGHTWCDSNQLHISR